MFLRDVNYCFESCLLYIRIMFNECFSPELNRSCDQEPIDEEWVKLKNFTIKIES